MKKCDTHVLGKKRNTGPPYVCEPRPNATSPFAILSYDLIRKLAKEYSFAHTPSPSQSPLKPAISKRHRKRPTAGSSLGVDTRVGLSPRMRAGLTVLPEGACGGWAPRQRRRAGMPRGGAWRAAGAGLGWESVAWSGGAGADDLGQPRIAVTAGSRESRPSGLELVPGPRAPGHCPGGPDDRSATGRRGWGPGLRAGLARGVSRHQAATRPSPPAGQRAQHVAPQHSTQGEGQSA
jgi:hypothetical protein